MSEEPSVFPLRIDWENSITCPGIPFVAATALRRFGSCPAGLVILSAETATSSSTYPLSSCGQLALADNVHGTAEDSQQHKQGAWCK